MNKWIYTVMGLAVFGIAVKGGTMSEKKFKLKPDQIKQLAPHHGRCFATDMITVEGHKVGFMYREKPKDKNDSGWTFLAGTETQEYMDNPHNIGIYEVNTIANYDPDIISLLNQPAGAAFERDSKSGKFIKTESPVPPED